MTISRDQRTSAGHATLSLVTDARLHSRLSDDEALKAEVEERVSACSREIRRLLETTGEHGATR